MKIKRILSKPEPVLRLELEDENQKIQVIDFYKPIDVKEKYYLAFLEENDRVNRLRINNETVNQELSLLERQDSELLLAIAEATPEERSQKLRERVEWNKEFSAQKESLIQKRCEIQVNLLRSVRSVLAHASERDLNFFDGLSSGIVEEIFNALMDSYDEKLPEEESPSGGNQGK